MSDYALTTEDVRIALEEFAWNHRTERPELFFADPELLACWLAAHDVGVRAQTLRDAAAHWQTQWPLHPLSSMHALHVESWLRQESARIEKEPDRVSGSGVVQGDAKLDAKLSGIEKEQSQ